MDSRRLDSMGVLASGILGMPAPKTDVPEGRDRVDAMDWDTYEFIGEERAREAVDSGAVLRASNYYGIPYLWRDGGVYRGLLLQYRAVTEDHTFGSLDEAVGWFERTYYATDG